MKKYNWIILLLICVAVFGVTRVMAERDGPTATVTSEPALPDFTFMDSNNTTHHFHDFADRKVIVHFWATWCIPCIQELPALLEYVDKHQDVTLLAFSSDGDEKTMQDFLASVTYDKNNPRILNIWDKDKAVAQQFKVYRYPESYLYGVGLKQVDHIVGSVDWPGFYAL